MTGNGNGGSRSRFWDWVSGLGASVALIVGGAMIASYSTDQVQDERIATNRAGLAETRKKVDKIEKTLGENALRDLRGAIDELRAEFRSDMKEVRSRLREIETRLPPK